MVITDPVAYDLGSAFEALEVAAYEYIDAGGTLGCWIAAAYGARVALSMTYAGVLLQLNSLVCSDAVLIGHVCQIDGVFYLFVFDPQIEGVRDESLGSRSGGARGRDTRPGRMD